MKDIDRRVAALDAIAHEEGYDSQNALLSAMAMESVVPGMCRACETVHSSCEPDMDEGYCESCGENRVESCLIIAGWI